MRVRHITSLREFDALAATWREISRTSGQTSPFLSHDWFACCWRSAGWNRRRELWLVEDAVGPLAAIPLVRSTAWRYGLPIRVVEFLSSPHSPFADVPVARGLEEVISLFLNALRVRGDWDILSIAKLPIHSMTLKALEAALPGQFRWSSSARTLSPCLTISGTWDTFWGQRTEQFRSECAARQALIERQGRVGLEHHLTVDPDGPVFADVKEVCEQSGRGADDALTETMQGMPRFFRELTGRASANGWLHLWILRLGGRAIATEYQLGENGSLYTLRADSDSSLAELAPDACLRFRIVRSLFENRRVSDYYLAPGRPDDLSWATSIQETVRLQVFAPSAYGRLLHQIETRLAPLARGRRSPSQQCA